MVTATTPKIQTRRPRASSAGLALCALMALWGLGAAPGTGQVSIRINNVIRVAARADSFTNCDRLQAVLASITDSSVSNRYLVELEPGNYHCGDGVVVLEEGVTLQGLGSVAIQSNFDSPNVGTVHLYSHSSLRDVRVFNSHPDANSVGSIAVSVFDFGTPAVDVELHRVRFLPDFDPPNNYALHAANAQVHVYHSLAGRGTVLVGAGGDATFDFSRLGSVIVNDGGAATCHLSSHRVTSLPLGSDCQP